MFCFVQQTKTQRYCVFDKKSSMQDQNTEDKAVAAQKALN